MERTSRLPSAPSRLPAVSSGVRVQSNHSTGLPRLFGRSSVSAGDLGFTSHVPLVSLVSPHDEARLLTENQEMSTEDQEWYSWIGKRVCISGVKKGVLVYYGRTLFAEGMFCGIHLDEPEGRHDGEFNGHRYFTCPNKHGVFAPVSKVEKVLTPKLPPISSPIYATEDYNRTFISGKSPGFCNISFNGTFTRERSPTGLKGGLNSTFVNSNAYNGGVNELYSPAKSQSVESDLDRTYSIEDSPTSTYTIQNSTPYHRSSTQSQCSLQKLRCDDAQLTCYDDDDSSLGLLNDSQMRDFSVDGLLLPKTQSCDDINELPEHEVVQDITVQYLDESITPSDCVTFHSTPMNKNDVKPACFPLEGSISDDRSYSMLADQEFPSLALEYTLHSVTESTRTPNLSSADDTTYALVPPEMPEEIVPAIIAEKELSVLTLGEAACESPPSEQQGVSCAVPTSTSSIFTKPDMSATSPGFVDIMTATGDHITVSRDAVIGALVTSMSKKTNLPDSVINQLSNTLRDKSSESMEITSVVVTRTGTDNIPEVTSPTEVQLQEKSQRSLETSMTKSVEWSDIVMVQHSGEEFKEERLSIEKVMEVIQAKGESGQRPASTYTVGSADTGYQGDGEFDLQSEIETASPCDEMKPLVSPSVSTSLSLDEMNGTLGGTGGSCKMGKSGHLSDSDFFTEDPGEAEGGVCTPPIMKEEVDPPSESPDDSIAGGSLVDDTLTEQAADLTFKVEEVVEEPHMPPETESLKKKTEVVETLRAAPEDIDIPKKSKKIVQPVPVKKTLGVPKVKAVLDTQPVIEPPKKVRTPKKSRWDAVTSKIQAGMAEEKVKPKKEVRGRVNTNLCSRTAVPVVGRKGETSPMGRRQSANDGSAGPASTRSTPMTESATLPADTDETASQATNSARGPSSVVSCCSQRGTIKIPSRSIQSSSTASACSSSSSTSSHCSVPPFRPTRHQNPPPSLTANRMPSKIAIRFQPRLETVAKVSDQAKKATRLVRSNTAKTPPSPQASKGLLHGTTTVLPTLTSRSGTSQPPPTVKPKAPVVITTKPSTAKPTQPMKSKTVKGQSSQDTAFGV